MFSGGGLGDDVFSVGYDGTQFWLGGTAMSVPSHTHSTLHSSVPTKRLERQKEITSLDDIGSLEVGDVIGCGVDLEKGIVWYTKNGESVRGYLKLFQECSDLLTPAVSFSTGTR